MSGARTYQRLVFLEGCLYGLETGKAVECGDVKEEDVKEEIKETEKEIEQAKQELEDMRR